MAHRSGDYQAIAWLKQRLEDLDTVIGAGEDALDSVEGAVKDRAEEALERLKSSREILESLRDDLRDSAAAAKTRGDEAFDRLEAEWLTVETTFQDFVSGFREYADVTQTLLAARARAQRAAWSASLEETRDLTKDALEAAGEEFEAAVHVLEGQFEGLKTRALQVGDAAWDGLSETVAKARATNERALNRLKDAFKAL
jgi:prefoldin subunit 5